MIQDIKEALAEFGYFCKAIVPPMIVITLAGLFFTVMAAITS